MRRLIGPKNSRRRAGAYVIRNPRGGKVAAQNAAVRQSRADVPCVLRRELHVGARRVAQARARVLPIPMSRTFCGRLNIQDEDGRNKEGVYWRYETRAARQPSRVSIR